MKPNKTFRSFYLLSTVSMTLLFSACGNDEDPTSEDPVSDDIGTLMAQSEDFSHFASLIAIADQEIPEGEKGIMQMLTDTESQEQFTIFAPSDEVFESIADEWSNSSFQASVEDVIAEFTHSGQPEKTRDFVLGHIFMGEVRYEFSAFQIDLTLESQKGIRWTMIAHEGAISGFGFVLENSPNSNPYLIYGTDVLVGSNGIVHAALVN